MIDNTTTLANPETYEERPDRFPGFDYKDYETHERMMRTKRDDSDYKRHTLHSGTYYNTDVFMGSFENQAKREWLFDATQGKLVSGEVVCSDGLCRTYLEILSNAGDNVLDSRNLGVDVGAIEVTMNHEWLTIKNYGEPIPIKPRLDISTYTKCLTTVDLIFGTFLSSSHYDKKVFRIGCGKNGLGGKLTNTFSKYFRVRAGDPKNGQEHMSVWQGNMKHLTYSQSSPGFVLGQVKGEDGKEVTTWLPAQGTKYAGPAYVEVAWKLDFPRFDCRVAPGGGFGYADTVIALFARYLIDFSLSCKIPVTFNGQRFDYRSIRDYASLHFSEAACKTSIVHFEWNTKDNEPPEALKNLTRAARERLIAKCPSAECMPTVELLALDTPDESRFLASVNGLMTIDGGVHVEEAYKKLSVEILDTINKSMVKYAKGERKKKSSKTEEKKEVKIPHLTPGDVKRHMSIIISCQLVDPVYTSQSKTILSKPKPKITLDEKTTDGMRNWQLLDRLRLDLEAKMQKTLSKSDGKHRRTFIDKGEHANEACGPKSQECILCGGEGDSAAAYIKRRISLLPGRKDYVGYLPFRGKLLNVTNADFKQIAENKELFRLKQMLGLAENVDYTQPENRRKLNYGLFMWAGDADTDGKHINSLVLNLFYKRFPSFLQAGLFAYLMTPVVRVFSDVAKKHLLHRFYTMEDFAKWERLNPGYPSTKIKYYKGLASSNDGDVKDDMTTAPMVVCVFDDRQASEALDLAFHKANSDARKRWIQHFRDKTGIDDITFMGASEILRQRNISAIINRDLVDYTIDALFRAIPSFRDGFKLSQRQLIYYVLCRWKYGRGAMKASKVSCIAASAIETVKYHHGVKSLEDAIAGMAQDFVGSNNLHYFFRDGQFGTRDAGGKDCGAGRYVETYFEWWIPYVYSEELVKLVPPRMVEGEAVEPTWLPCDIPMHMINGALGVATGHSTYIPPHHPLEVIRWLYERCGGTEHPKPIKPWFRGFRGTITIVDKGSKESREIKRDLPTPSRLVTEKQSESKSRLVVEEKQTPPPAEEVEDIDEEIPDGDDPDEPTDSSDDADADSTDIAIATGDRKKGLSMVTRGCFEITHVYPSKKVDLVITELPIGRWMSVYKKKVLEKWEQAKIITSHKDTSTPDTAGYEIKGFMHPKGATIDTLKLQKSYGLSNMTLIDDSGFPFHFPNTQAILEAYFRSMLEVYNLALTKRIEKAEAEHTNLSYKHQLIISIVEGKIIIIEEKKARPEEDIRKQLDTHKIPFEYYEKLKAKELNATMLAKLRDKIAAKVEEIATLKRTQPQNLWMERLRAFDAELRKQRYGVL